MFADVDVIWQEGFSGSEISGAVLEAMGFVIARI